jgi:hypothetical protein
MASETSAPCVALDHGRRVSPLAQQGHDTGMAEALSGNLAQLKLIDILRLLHLSGRTGQLELTTEDGKFGEIYLVGGLVSHALYEEWIGEEAVYGLFSWGEGTFRFHSDETTDERTVSLGTDQIIEEAATYASEWERIRTVVPSSSAIYRLAARPSADVQLRAEDWSVLTQLDGEKTILEIAEASQLNELFTSKIISRLHELGLIELVAVQMAEPAPAADFVDDGFIAAVEADLIQAIGPMASIVVEDCAEQMGHGRGSIPKDAVPELIERLANEIPDSARRTKFQEAMLERMRNMY